jgi:hypothetical protein
LPALEALCICYDDEGKKKKLFPGRNGLFRFGLHFKIIFIIANTLPKTGFYLTFTLLAFKDETFAALPAADRDFDSVILHKHPPVCHPQKRRGNSADSFD